MHSSASRVMSSGSGSTLFSSSKLMTSGPSSATG